MVVTIEYVAFGISRHANECKFACTVFMYLESLASCLA